MRLVKEQLKGVWTAVVTPFTSGGAAVDYDSLKNILEAQMSAGVSGIVVCGSTGEASTLSEREYIQVVEYCAKGLSGRIPAIAGINSGNTARAMETARMLEATGVSGVLLTCPPYNKPTQEGLYRHFCSVAQATSLPLVAYNIPGRTGVNMCASTVRRLAVDRVIVGIKESSNIDQILDLIVQCDGTISVMSGDDSLALSSVVSGGQGVVSVISNLAPAMMRQMLELCSAGRVREAADMQKRLLPLMRSAFVETNPIPIKAALKIKGLIGSAGVRLPLVDAQKETFDKLNAVMADGGFE